MPNTLENAGKPVAFEIGDTIYEQGSQSSGVYMILDGQVDIWRTEGQQAHHIASIGGGELLGEVSVIEKTHHSVTAKVSRPTNTLFIEADAFRRSFSDPLVRHVVNTLAARLRSSYAVSAAIQEETAKASSKPKSHLPTIEGASRVVADKFLTFVEIAEFPFVVGNINSRDKHSISNDTSLRIPLPGLRELADSHFELVRRDGGLSVRDLGSPQGTTVNGEALSKYGLTATAKLRKGQNEIIAGGNESPVRFIVTIPEDYEG
jgi:CRP-like cAMP-binding protein